MGRYNNSDKPTLLQALAKNPSMDKRENRIPLVLRICLTISRFFATCFRHYVAKTRSRITTTVTFSRQNDASLCASIKNLALVVVLVLESKLSYAYLCFINQDYLLTRYESARHPSPYARYSTAKIVLLTTCNHPIILSNLQPTRRDHL